jgi:hypothetical protein
MSGIPITGIAASINTAAGEEYDSGGDPLIFEITFGSGVSSWFRVGDVNNVLSLIVNKVNAARGGAAWQYPLQMMPSQYLATMVDFYRARERCASFHTGYLDGSNNEFKADGKTSNEQGVRFDQWLIHHLLGESYFATFMNGQLTDPTYKARLKEACDLAGIATDANGVPIQSLENDINNVLPWFLLYTAQAENTEKTPAGAPVSFLGWLAAQGVTDITQLAPAQLVALMREYGLEPGPGFIDIPDRYRAA